MCDAPSPFEAPTAPSAEKLEYKATIEAEPPAELRARMARSGSGVRSLTDPEPEGDLDSFEEPAPGEIIDGRYQLVRVLGRGATGVVYEATHRLMGTRLALKCLHPQHSASPVAVERLIREARIAAGLQHPNVVSVIDGGRDRDIYYIAMELLEGEPLSAFLARGQQPIPTIVAIFAAIMDGVAKVQSTGVVHRDLKPDNVFLSRNEHGEMVPKVLDFGVSKLREPGQNGQLTELGMAMGTPFYMASEQFADTRNVDARADVYSLGVMLYEALSGQVPYPGETVLEVFNQAMAGRPVALRELRPDVPQSLEVLVARAMCNDREARYADVREMREALAAVVYDGTDRSSKQEPWILGTTDPGAALPIESAPTQVATRRREVAKTVDLGRSPLLDLPSENDKRTKILLIAGTAGAVLLMAFGLGVFLVWWLVT